MDHGMKTVKPVKLMKKGLLKQALSFMVFTDFMIFMY
jgi:hypothetical protein